MIPKVEGRCEIGKFYMTPCLRASQTPPPFARAGQWVPVLPPKHDDPEIGIHFEHYHLDFRFLPKWSFERADFGDVLSQPVGYPDPCRSKKFYEEGLTYRRMKCKREMPAEYPFHKAGWLPKLRERYAAARLVNGICPHKGLDLSGCPAVKGIITCPGHGLSWDAETGALALPETAASGEP